MTPQLRPPRLLIASDDALWRCRVEALANDVIGRPVVDEGGAHELRSLADQVRLGARDLPDVLVLRAAGLARDEAQALGRLTERGVAVVVVASDDELGEIRHELELASWPPWSGVTCVAPRDEVLLRRALRRVTVLRRPRPARRLLDMPREHLLAILDRHSATLDD